MINRNLKLLLTIGCVLSTLTQNTLHGFPLEPSDEPLLETSNVIGPIKRAADHSQIVTELPSSDANKKSNTNLGSGYGIEPGGGDMLMFQPKLFELSGEEQTTTIKKDLESDASKTEISTTTQADEELTISMSPFKEDLRRKLNDNPWAVTFGHIWLDTRYKLARNQGVKGVTMGIRPAQQQYYPDEEEKLSTVCRSRSTVYNIPRVFDWLPRHQYNHTHLHRPIWLELRRELYKFGNSEECHIAKLDKWRDYEECALRRNQRMEYMIPKYPLRQIGYYSRWSQYYAV
ncbi:uncharacterized protein LOC6648093 [Drosophila willistoni]|uniref:uncharacterized protein LOC6648093 n=1 Tax=Drosophila willistoni TaxID=7260 RepID=UPI000C26D9E0|nr:uncharacterized protein LOC6648093 [Drosophila willistoni]